MFSSKNTTNDNKNGAGSSNSTNHVINQVNNQDNEYEWICIGHKDKYSIRTHIKVYGRRVTVLRLKNDKWNCIDTICYHAGGPLTNGNIKQINNRNCIQCPWHSYLVDIDTGEGLYMDLDRSYQSKGKRQRVHQIKLQDNQHVYIKLNNIDKNIASDTYAYGFSFLKQDDKHLPSFPNNQSLDW